MNPSIKASWVEALRSGDYSQGKGWLRKGDAYCCLGVLCDLLDPGGWRFDPVDGEWRWVIEYEGGSESGSGYLPRETLRKVRLDSEHQDMLLTMNDSGRTFERIANYIEKYV